MSASLATIEAVLDHLHNYFPRETVTDTFSVGSGVLSPSLDGQTGQYYWITGSVFNDGLHKIGGTDLTNEAETPMTIHLLAVPLALVAICGEIEDWLSANGQAMQTAAASPYQSESFGGYSYTIKGDLASGSASQGLTGWQAAFKSRLDRWRKL